MTKHLCKRNKTADILDIKSDAGYVYAIFATFDSVNAGTGTIESDICMNIDQNLP